MDDILKVRISLLIIIIALLGFLYIFQNWFDAFWGIIFVLALVAMYMIYTYFVIKHQRRKLRKNPIQENPDFKPSITIMVPAHNEACVIEKTIENILKIDYDNFDVIVIDDRSTDDTKIVVQELAEKYANVRCLIREQDAFPGKSAVLNDALKMTNSDAVLVFDADAKVEPDFIRKLLPVFEPDNVGAVQAQKRVMNAKQNLLTRCQYNELIFDTYVQIGRDAVKGAVELRGNGELIKRKALDDIGGWNEETITDDLDMSTRLHISGWDIRFCPDAIVFEEAVLTYTALIKQRRRWVEGSIRRYLEFAKEIFTSKDMSLRCGFDLIVYLSEFLLPFWMVSEVALQAFRYVRDNNNNILSSMLVFLAAGVFFWTGFIYSLQKYSHYSGLKAIWMAFITSIYMIVFWVPVVFYVILKIIFAPKTMDWGKTVHGVCQGEEKKANG